MMESKNGKDIQSHIQMPKLLLKRFEKGNRFFYYDVKKGIIGNHGTARSANTQKGYYSEEIEQYLSQNIETPFSKMIQLIDSLDLDNPSFRIDPIMRECIIDFFYALIARNPILISEIDKESIYFQFLSEQDRHDYAVHYGIEYLKEIGYLKDYGITFLVNKSNLPLVSPISGIYSFKIMEIDCHMLPVSPIFGIVLVKREELFKMTKNGIIPLFQINQEQQAFSLNQNAFKTQCKLGYGIIISPDMDVLKRLKADYCREHDC